MGENKVIMGYYHIRVTSLEQLSLAEFSGELAGPTVYENGHKRSNITEVDEQKITQT